LLDPTVVLHGSEVRAIIHLIDQADTDHPLELSPYVDRSALIQHGERSARKFPGLFGPGEYERSNQHPREASNFVSSTDSERGAL
jgi:hypothetical protein